MKTFVLYIQPACGDRIHSNVKLPSKLYSLVFKRKVFGDFPGSPVVKTSPPNAGGAGLIPGWGAKIAHASGPKNPKHKNRSNIVTNQ